MDPVFVGLQQALAGRYSIEGEVGRGGMGIVYRAREVLLDRLVALKVLPPEHALDDERRARFQREARMAAKLSHPNIVPIFAVDEVDGYVFYVMAYVDGVTLAHRVATQGPLPSAEATRILREVAWALGHAHANGVIHRDVKPENILLEAGTGRALVADFGIAAALGDVDERLAGGTPEFMSPEQALGRELDARSDIYGLGATAYFACSGRVPFEGTRAVEVLAKHVTEPAPNLGSIGTTVPRRLAQVVERCLAKDPAQRPASAQLLADQLGASLDVRRDVPAVLRAFVKRDARLEGPLVLAGFYMLSMGAAGVGAATTGLIGLATWGAGLIGLPTAYFLWAARRVVRHGFRHEDLAAAFSAEVEQAREEFEVQHGRSGLRLEKFLGWTSLVAVGVAIGSTVLFASFGFERGWTRLFGPLTGVSWLVLLPSYLGFRLLRNRRPHAGILGWAKLWNGRLGRAAFALARKLLRGPITQAAVTHRATELSLGLAAEELFEGLPKPTRLALGDVPGVLKRLQHQAHALKVRLDALRSALEDAGDRAEDEEFRDIREERDETATRVREVVGALETTRLNLLRLHAGSLSVSGLTTQFGAAADLARDVERLIEARAEVDRALRNTLP